MDPATWMLIVGALVKYGPEVASDVSDWYHNKTVPTRDEIKATFAKAKAYSQFNIPDVAPKS